MFDPFYTFPCLLYALIPSWANLAPHYIRLLPICPIFIIPVSLVMKPSNLAPPQISRLIQHWYVDIYMHTDNETSHWFPVMQTWLLYLKTKNVHLFKPILWPLFYQAHNAISCRPLTTIHLVLVKFSMFYASNFFFIARKSFLELYQWSN